MEKSIGPINSIVLARAGESDKIYKKDQNSIESNGLCELMISENQFMNFNDRVDYLQELSDKLFGVEYYLNDFVSTGIMYYDLLDMYNVKIGDKTYNCLMLNDEQDITQGLEENIYTERPEKSETDYTKADKTDRKINQTYIIVDKQNQEIDMVVSNVNNITNTKGEAEGKNIHLTDSAEEPLIDISLHGESTQKTRSGKNLLDNTATTKISNGITFTVNSDKTVNVNGTNDTSANSSLIINRYDLSPGTYILNGCPSGGSSTTYRLVIQKTSGWSVLGLDTGSGSEQFTIDEATNIQVAIFIQKGQTISNLLFKPMIRLSSIIDDTYEQYGASPSPDYPSPIENIEGNIELKATNGLEETDENYQEQVATFPLGEEKLMEGSYLADDGIHHSRKQVVLDGTENWALTSTDNQVLTKRFSANITSNMKVGSANTALSTHFSVTENATEDKESMYFASLGTITYIALRISVDKATTVEQLKIYLATEYANGTPVIVEYELAEEEIVPYTTAQQEAWNNIRALMTYKNVTNISSDAYAKIIYVRDNGLDVYETKSSARQTKQQVAQQKITIDQILSRVSEIEDFSREVEGIGYLHLIETAENEGLVINLKIKGNTNKFKTLVPRETLVPSESLVPYGDTITIISDTSTALTENAKEYTIPIGEPLRNNGTTYDELSITSDGTITITRRISSNGSILTTPTIEILEEKYPIFTFKNDTYLYIRDYPDIDMYCKYVIDSDYIETFATQGNLENAVVELDSEIKQTASEINLEVSKKVGNDEVISKINQSAEAVGINANKIELSANDVLNLLAGNAINLTSKNITISSDSLNIDKYGNITLKATGTRVFKVENSTNANQRVYITDTALVVDGSSQLDRASIGILDNNDGIVSVSSSSGSVTEILGTGITTPKLTQTSLESQKKNFEKMQNNALNIIRNIDIYKYNLKNEKDTDKKHIGFVIGDNYKYSKEVTSLDNTGVDTYSFISLCCKAIQEQQKQIELLQQEINKLKGEK